MPERVGDLGERSLLQRLHRFCPAELVGDDAAVLDFPSDRALVVTADTLVDGIHFSDRTTAPEDAGWRAIAANLSDLAAMGARPLGVTVSLALPAETEVDWLDRLYRGMAELLRQFGTPIIGGDVCRAPTRSLAITALGSVRSPVHRDGARVGDAIVVTGVHGASRGGLELLLSPERGASLSEKALESLCRAHQRPFPRLDLLKFIEPLAVGNMAGMDSSDGLADAVVQLARESGVGALVFGDRLPVAPELFDLTSPEEARDWTLYGGEDFELVLCLPPEAARGFCAQVETAAIVGEIVAEPGAWLLSSGDGDGDRVSLSQTQGFQHF